LTPVEALREACLHLIDSFQILPLLWRRKSLFERKGWKGFWYFNQFFRNICVWIYKSYGIIKKKILLHHPYFFAKKGHKMNE
jgi:hypothetical protein